MKILIKAGADVNLQRFDKQEGLTPLMLAAKNGHASCVELLIKAGAEVNLSDGRHYTARDHAVNNGHYNFCYLFCYF